jgi:hypothetical protein
MGRCVFGKVLSEGGFIHEGPGDEKDSRVWCEFEQWGDVLCGEGSLRVGEEGRDGDIVSKEANRCRWVDHKGGSFMGQAEVRGRVQHECLPSPGEMFEMSVGWVTDQADDPELVGEGCGSDVGEASRVVEGPH